MLPTVACTGSVSTIPTETTPEECNETLKAENKRLNQRFKDVTSFVDQQVKELEPVLQKLQRSRQALLESSRYQDYLTIQGLKDQKIPWRHIPTKFRELTERQETESSLRRLFSSMNEALELAGIKEPEQDILDEPPKPNSVSHIFKQKVNHFSHRVSSSILSDIDYHPYYCTEQYLS
jgi:hypothetical protein